MKKYLLDRYGITTTPNGAAEVMHCSASHVRALCQRGELPAVRVGERWRISTVKLARLLEGEQNDD